MSPGLISAPHLFSAVQSVLLSNRGQSLHFLLRGDWKSVVVFLPVRLMADFWSVMSEAESLSRCGLRSLAKGVSELLNRFAEEVLALLEARGGRTLGRLLRLLLSERLAAATERIVRLLERELEEYQRQLERQRRLLDAVLSPVVRLGRTGEKKPH